MYDDSDRVLVLVRDLAFLPSSSMLTGKKKILSLENIYNAKSFVNNTHKVPCKQYSKHSASMEEVQT